jgi:peroxisome-assembly ATPase
MPDVHQTQVVNDLQDLYEQLKTYEPKGPAGGISKWISFGKKEVKVPDIKGLYIYGSVGGGKTMLVRTSREYP